MFLPESHYCTDFFKPDVEKYYWNCSGFKSKEIMATHQPDSNGSWLRQFSSESEFYRVTLSESFKPYYWDMGKRTPAQVTCKWVGKCSQNWVTAANTILKQLE
jgi:hypothetical protein